jgi:hypothetical protein
MQGFMKKGANGCEDRGMRYFFHAANGESVYADEAGQECADAQSAMAQAATIAGQLAEDDDMNGFWISVTDEDGKEMGEVPVASRIVCARL